MKNLLKFILFSLTGFVFAQQDHSPYLLVNTKNTTIPLKESKTVVQISGTMAYVHLKQVYHNLGTEAIEAKYVFPMSTQAAVHKMQMTIGRRIINAKIFEKEQANKIYQQALDQGKRAAKLDQERPNVFQMNVGNIMPNDQVAIDIYYTELLEPINGIYQFIAPGVVGPRFTGKGTAPVQAFQMPYTKKDIKATFNYDIIININGGVLIKNVESPTHAIDVSYENAKTAKVVLARHDDNPGNRDYILHFNLRGDQIQSGLLLYEHKDENFFAFIIEPPHTVTLSDIPPREYLFIVDVSGSMNGYPLEVSRNLMRNLLCNLQTTDTFNVQLFASGSTLFSPEPVEANSENIEGAIRFLSEGQGGGGTQLLAALRSAYDLPRKDPGSSRSLVVITDGYVQVEKEAFELIRTHLDKANVFTFGIGSSVNRYLIEGMATVSNSKFFVATSMEEAQQVAMDFKKYISSPLLTQVKLQAKGFEVYDVTPATIPDVFAARPIVVYGKYKGRPKGKLILSGYQGKKRIKSEHPVSEEELSPNNKALRYLWARKKMAELDDYGSLFNTSTKDTVLALGLKYNLASRFTSFVAVDETVVNENGVQKIVKQPLPMPQNVENSAIGAEAAIEGHNHFKGSYQITFAMASEKTEAIKRQMKMIFKAVYSKWVKKYLKEYEVFRIQLDTNGFILCVERLENGRWIADKHMTDSFPGSDTPLFSLGAPITIIIKK